MSIAGIILAAGMSERMDGGVKQLLAFGDRTMVGHVVATVESTSLDPIVVVTGHLAEEVETAMTPQRARTVRNPRYESGNMSSLLAGLDALVEPQAVMVLVADQPEMDPATIEALAAAWEEWRPFAAVATYGGEMAHPWVLSAGAIDEARSLTGTKAVWRWLTADHADDLLEVEIDRPRPTDVNTLDDYHTVLRDLGLWDSTAG